MESPTSSRLGKHEALETAANEFRDAQGTDRDEILAARRALWRAEKAAEGRTAAPGVDDLDVEEAQPLLDRLAGLTEEGECLLDMAPGISTGHDGVLVVTDRRLLFVGLRHRFALPYASVRDVAAGGRWFGARLVVSTTDGKTVVSGLPPRRAADIAELMRRHLGASAPAPRGR